MSFVATNTSTFAPLNTASPDAVRILYRAPISEKWLSCVVRLKSKTKQKKSNLKLIRQLEMPRLSHLVLHDGECATTHLFLRDGKSHRVQLSGLLPTCQLHHVQVLQAPRQRASGLFRSHSVAKFGQSHGVHAVLHTLLALSVVLRFVR